MTDTPTTTLAITAEARTGAEILRLGFRRVEDTFGFGIDGCDMGKGLSRRCGQASMARP